MNSKKIIKKILLAMLIIILLAFNIFNTYKLSLAYDDINTTICNQFYDIKNAVKEIEITENMSINEMEKVGQQLYDNCYPLVKQLSSHRVHGGVYEIFDFRYFETVIIDLNSLGDNISEEELNNKSKKLLNIMLLFKDVKLPQNTYDFQKDPLEQVDKIKELTNSFIEYNAI